MKGSWSVHDSCHPCQAHQSRQLKRRSAILRVRYATDGLRVPLGPDSVICNREVAYDKHDEVADDERQFHREQIGLRAPRARVWRALTDAAEFGTWFGVKLEGSFEVVSITPNRPTSLRRIRRIWAGSAQWLQSTSPLPSIWHS